MQNKKLIILGQIGSPKSTKVSDVRSYLREFLSDPRVVDLPRALWWLILNLFILPTRPKRSAEAYKRIEFCGFFPLVEITKALKRKLSEKLSADYEVREAFLLSEPRMDKTLKEMKGSKQEIWVLPQFPQFSDTTTSCFTDKIAEQGMSEQVQMIKNYHNLRAFIDLSVKQIEAQIQKYPVDDIVISFHGIPERYVTAKKDIYYQHCYETFILLRKHLSLSNEKIHISFQSRLGSEKWLSPYTDEYCVKLVESGQAKKLAVYCPSFVADCLETTDEIGNELKHELESVGGELTFIPCLNNQDQWVEGYAEFIQTYIEKGHERAQELCYEIDKAELERTMPKLTGKSNSMTPKAKKTVKVVFLTLFLDLIGFSIIFPMFPALAKYYLEVDKDNYFLSMIMNLISQFGNYANMSMNTIVLFGGVLGALYSVLQFIAAPLWGGLSDRFGRKPILLISVFGLFLSYVLWIFSGSFTLLILARFIGGIMGGNLSVATAAVADVTDKKTRSSAMAYVGIAFAFGFIFGPAIGGILSLFNPLDYWPALESIGINPFSFVASFAALLSFMNLFFILKNFDETLESENKTQNFKTSNILKLFTPLPIRNVNLTNMSYFLFITAFSGMEFTLTFLAVERLAYSSMNNAYMFIFIGVVLALVQGGYVRRKAHLVGEKKMAMRGLMILVPGLIIIAFAKSSLVLYLGLFFLSVGSAISIPTMTSLVSLFSPENLQGKSLGIFRSLGSLGRVLGPIIASVSYWRLGSTIPYLGCALFLVVPLYLLSKIKNSESMDKNKAIN